MLRLRFLRGYGDMPLRRKEILTGLVVPLLFLVGFGLGEVSLRLLQFAKFGTDSSVERSKLFFQDAETGLRLPVPGSRHGRIRINNLGFRGPEIALPKPRGTIRLAFLGSSTTYDPYCDEQSNWPILTTSLLREAFPNCAIDFFNAGVPGFSTEHMLKHFVHHAAPLGPDVVVILPGGINADAADLARKKGAHTGAHYRPSFLASHSLLWGRLEKNVHIVRLQRAAHLSQGKLKFEPGELSSPFERRLTEAIRTLRDHASVVAVIKLGGQLRRDQSPKQQVRAANTTLFYMPYMSIRGLLDARDEFNRVIERVAAREGALVVAGEEGIPGDTIHYADSAHFTAAGSRLMAERVGEALLENAAVRALAGGCSRPPTTARTGPRASSN
jgi:hypothetical protein